MTPRPKLYAPKSMELVEVVWDDATMDFDYDGPASGWEGGIVRLRSVGYFVSSDRQAYILASTREKDETNIRMVLSIPRKLILSVVSLEKEIAAEIRPAGN